MYRGLLGGCLWTSTNCEWFHAFSLSVNNKDEKIILTPIFLSPMLSFAQDVIVKKDGSTVVCRIVEVNETEVIYKKWTNLEGANYVMERSAVSAINYESGRKETLSKDVENLYAPDNQNDGSRQMNDRALLELDAATHQRKKIIVDCKWHLRAGYSINTMTGGTDLSPTSGYDLGFGTTLTFNKKKWFIGADIFFASIGCKNKYVYTPQQTHGVDVVGAVWDYMPNDPHGAALGKSIGFTPYFGYRFDVSESFKIEPYIGPYIAYIGDGWGQDYDIYGTYKYTNGLSYRTRISSYRFDDTFTFGINVGSRFLIGEMYFLDVHLLKDFAISDYHRQQTLPYFGITREKGIVPLNFTIGAGIRF